VTNAAGSTPENPIDSATPWVANQINEYLATDGEKPDDFPYGAPLLLLTTKGRKSGEWKRTALIGAEDDGRYVIVASMGGAPKHPIWYLNLQENPEVRLQVKGQAFAANARTATAEEKPELWAKMVGLYPDYADYQEKTERDIPVVILDPVA
jgi:deazaflavin-dependent oxidoreductase (nitroreductase family)